LIFGKHAVQDRFFMFHSLDLEETMGEIYENAIKGEELEQDAQRREGLKHI
jgi:hypothetical protein